MYGPNKGWIKGTNSARDIGAKPKMDLGGHTRERSSCASQRWMNGTNSGRDLGDKPSMDLAAIPGRNRWAKPGMDLGPYQDRIKGANLGRNLMDQSRYTGIEGPIHWTFDFEGTPPTCSEIRK